ncbi:hypothetical protein QR685DRAFT_7660 [Neurospora intermedia]|uniref:Uncharacterized protein n=1 Tax=Neurospora intermedia TaxID=5142 RepID=A0ABR3DNY9_NEUIN
MEHTGYIKSPPSIIITTAELCSLLLQAPLLHNWKLSLDLIKFVNQLHRQRRRESYSSATVTTPTLSRGYQCYAIDRPAPGRARKRVLWVPRYFWKLSVCYMRCLPTCLPTYRLPYLYTSVRTFNIRSTWYFEVDDQRVPRRLGLYCRCQCRGWLPHT